MQTHEAKHETITQLTLLCSDVCLATESMLVFGISRVGRDLSPSVTAINDDSQPKIAPAKDCFSQIFSAREFGQDTFGQDSFGRDSFGQDEFGQALSRIDWQIWLRR